MTWKIRHTALCQPGEAAIVTELQSPPEELESKRHAYFSSRRRFAPVPQPASSSPAGKIRLWLPR